MFNWIGDPGSWAALLSLTLLEVVLGIDNIVFISILASKLEKKEEQEKARKLGLLVALVSRVVLVMLAGFIVTLKTPIFTLPLPFLGKEGMEVSWKDLIVIVGGLFLIWKATKEIHAKLEGADDHHEARVKPTLGAILWQVLLLDVIFSVDSVITAVGMIRTPFGYNADVTIMVIAVMIAVFFMLIYSKPIAHFVEKHPTVKMLALAFLILIGVTLLAEGFGQHIEKGFIYFAMAFAVMVEMLNLRVRGKAVQLKQKTVIPVD